jgi:hypothetical protein
MKTFRDTRAETLTSDYVGLKQTGLTLKRKASSRLRNNSVLYQGTSGFSPRGIAFLPRLEFFRNLLEALHGEEQGVQKNRKIQKDAAVLDIVQVILDRLMDDELAVAA